MNRKFGCSQASPASASNHVLTQSDVQLSRQHHFHCSWCSPCTVIYLLVVWKQKLAGVTTHFGQRLVFSPGDYVFLWSRGKLVLTFSTVVTLPKKISVVFFHLAFDICGSRPLRLKVSECACRQNGSQTIQDKQTWLEWLYNVHDVWLWPVWSTHWLWKALIVADQTKWTPALCQAPVCLKWSGQSVHTANKWRHSLCPGSASPSPSLLSLLCSLWVI